MLFDWSARGTVKATVTTPLAAAVGGGATAAASALGRAGDAVAVTAATAVAAGGAGASSSDVDFARLELSGSALLERHLELLTDVTDQLLYSQHDVAFVARRTEYMKRQRDEWLARRVSERLRGTCVSCRIAPSKCVYCAAGRRCASPM